MTDYTFTNTDKCLEGYGNKNTITITIENSIVKDVKFLGRPSIPPNLAREINQRQPFLSNKGIKTEVCHRLSVEVLKQEVRKEFVNKPPRKPDFKFLYMKFKTPESEEAAYTAYFVAESLRKKITDYKNLFLGESGHNNFAGKLCLLLLPAVRNGRAAFEKKINQHGTYTIPVRSTAYMDYSSLIDELFQNDPAPQALVFHTWDELLDWFFAANYDESDAMLSVNNREMEARRLSQKPWEKYKPDAIKRFKAAYDYPCFFRTSLSPEAQAALTAGLGESNFNDDEPSILGKRTASDR